MSERSPAPLERSQRDWAVSLLFLLELIGIFPAIQIRKISEIRVIRGITAALSKKTCLSLHKKREFSSNKRAFCLPPRAFLSASPKGAWVLVG